MDPEIYEKTPTELPAPSYKLDLEPQPSDNESEAVASIGVERGQSSGGHQSSTVTTDAGQLQSTQSGSVASSLSATSHSLPQIADDNDLIEKEWVAKAKQIVEKTKHDPRAQNTEISVVKAGYIKKRFNKDIKVNDSP